MPAQNIYDDPQFYACYEKLRANGTALNEVLEQPALYRLLPDSLDGLRILDLGCGFGDFARGARRAGAREVLGVDVSARMLETARQRTDDPAIRYLQTSIEALEVNSAYFDLVVSSLALHYVADYPAALRRIAAAMCPGARLVFSVEHPICTTLAAQTWHRDGAGAKTHWPVDDYRVEGPRHTHWFVDGVVKYHRTIETYVNGLFDAGLQLRRLEEPGPLPAALERDPALNDHQRRPPFLLLAADLPF
jgi:SAM-dependent methyltransferase